MKKIFIQVTILLAIQSLLSNGGSPNEWRSRSIYQVLTDRFATSDGSTSQCFNIIGHCGGTFQGIMRNLDYITGMGFDAIWISPIVENVMLGYHGYWTKNFYKINSNFGTEEDLRELVETAHNKGVWIMLDVVLNHAAPIGEKYSKITPFNKAEHYHKKCHIQNWDDVWQLHNCRLSNLPDLAQEHPYVKKTLIEWARDLIYKYKIDGLRLDAAVHVPHDFWREFTPAVGAFTMGEVIASNYLLLTSYQGPIHGLLNYPMYYVIRDVFREKHEMWKLENYFKDTAKLWQDQGLLGNFVNNHDQVRFLYKNNDITAFKAALAFTICMTGIPIVYYGDEQGFNGGSRYGFLEFSREILWRDMNTDHEIYQFIRRVNLFRKEVQFYWEHQVQRYSDQDFYAFSRGMYLFAFTNRKTTVIKTISYHPYQDGHVLCNLFWPDDCVKVKGGKFEVHLVKGEVKILFPEWEKEKIVKNVISKQLEKIAYPIKTPSKIMTMVKNVFHAINPVRLFSSKK